MDRGRVTVMDDERSHYKAKMVLAVIGISLGAVSYAYAGSIVGTTLGQSLKTGAGLY